YWDVLYDRMEKTEEETPRLDSITSRGSSITLRLSMIIALLDGSATIRKEHVEAAYALWCYGRDTARYLFGQKLSSPVAERIFGALKNRYPDGMTKTDIIVLLGRNVRTEVLNPLLKELEDFELIEHRKEKNPKGGPPAIRYFWQKN